MPRGGRIGRFQIALAIDSRWLAARVGSVRSNFFMIGLPLLSIIQVSGGIAQGRFP